jgi:four helix bundle protein
MQTFGRFVEMARGSACEVEYHLLLAHDLKLLNDVVYNGLNSNINEIKRMLHGLSRYLTGQTKQPTTATPK